MIRLSEPKLLTLSSRMFQRMRDIDLFDDQRVELIRGKLWKSEKDSHAENCANTKLCLHAVRYFAEISRYWFVVRGHMKLGRNTVARPDLCVLDAPLGTPESKLPLPFMVVEVSDRSYSFDAGEKLQAYAEAGIADYWIENLNADRIEVYRDPFNLTGKRSDWTYREIKHYGRGEEIKLLAFPNIALAVNELLP